MDLSSPSEALDEMLRSDFIATSVSSEQPQMLPNEEQAEALWMIWRHPYLDYNKIAPQLNLTADQMNRRVREFRNNAWLEDQHIVKLEAMGYGLRYRIDVKLVPAVLTEMLPVYKGGRLDPTDNPQVILAQYIAEHLGVPQDAPIKKGEAGKPRLIVEDVFILLGDPADLSVTVRAKEHDDVFEWVTRRLRAMPGVENTSTCLEAWHIEGGNLSERTNSEESSKKVEGRASAASRAFPMSAMRLTASPEILH